MKQTTKKESLSNLIFGSSSTTDNVSKLFVEPPLSLKRKIDDVENEGAIDEVDENKDDSNGDDDDQSVSSNEESEPDSIEATPNDEPLDSNEEQSQEQNEEMDENAVKENGNLESEASEKDKNKSNTATKESEEELNKRTIFVGNLPPTTTRKTLTKLFKPCGKIQTTRLRSQATTTIKLPPDQAGKQTIMKKVCANKKLIDTSIKSNAQGYVVFESIDSVSKGLQMNNTKVQDDETEEEYVIRVDTVPPTINNDLSIFIGNLRFRVQEQTLRNFFQEKCGGADDIIQNVRIVRDNKTMQCKGVAYILFKNYGAVKKAVTVNGTKFEGRELRIMRCKKQIKKQRKDIAPGAMRRLKEKEAKKSAIHFNKNDSSTKKKKVLVRRKTSHAKHKKGQRPSGVTKRAAKEKKLKDTMKKVEKRFKKQERRTAKKSFL